MPVFEYKALDGKGKQISGFLDANDLATAKARLREAGHFPTRVAEVAGKKEAPRRFPLFSPRIRGRELALMTRQLATLVSAGFSLVQALNALVPQMGKPAMKRVVSTIKDRIEEGADFARALGEYPGIFSGIYVQMVRAGEASGTLGLVLERLAEITENQNRVRQKIRAALAYPLLMGLVGTGVLFFLISVVVPNITAIFEEMNQTLPWSTRMLIRMGEFATSGWWVMAVAVILFFVLGRLLLSKPRIRRAVDALVLKLPILGALTQKTMAARFSRTLGALLENGVSLLDALKILETITGNRVMEAAIRNAGGEVERGRELGDALGETRVFPSLLIQMIQVGEQSGDLPAMLKKAAGVYEDEVETSLVALTALLEPLIILVMAVVVGFIVLSVCLPIFEMNQLGG